MQRKTGLACAVRPCRTARWMASQAGQALATASPRTGDPQLGKLRHCVRLRPGLYRDQQLTSAGVRGHPPLLWSKLWSKLWSNQP